MAFQPRVLNGTNSNLAPVNSSLAMFQHPLEHSHFGMSPFAHPLRALNASSMPELGMVHNSAVGFIGTNGEAPGNVRSGPLTFGEFTSSGLGSRAFVIENIDKSTPATSALDFFTVSVILPHTLW